MCSKNTGQEFKGTETRGHARTGKGTPLKTSVYFPKNNNLLCHNCPTHLSHKCPTHLSHKPTTLALLSTVHQWHLYLEDHKEVYATFLDLKKAFDTVPHCLLINKLSDIGLNNLIIRWICSYLTDREQVVVLDGCSSARCNVTSGVPQGSMLRPLLFLLY